MSVEARTIQVTLYVSSIPKPSVVVKGCEEGHCLQPGISERLSLMTNDLEEKFYSTETQKIINAVRYYCNKREIPLKIEDITGVRKRVMYFAQRGILRTPTVEIRKGMKIRLRAPYTLNSVLLTDFLNKITTI